MKNLTPLGQGPVAVAVTVAVAVGSGQFDGLEDFPSNLTISTPSTT